MPASEIAATLDLSPRMVASDIVFIRRRWREMAAANVDQLIADQLSKYNAIEREAWEQWDRSKEDAETVTSSDTNGETRTSKGQSGNPAYLDIIRKTGESRSKLLGIERKQPTNQTNIQINLPQSRDDLLTEAARLLRDRLDLDPSALLPINPMEHPECPAQPAKLPLEPPSSSPPSSE